MQLENLRHSDVLVELNKDLKKFSTMRLNSFGDLITVKSIEGLKYVLVELYKNGIRYKVLGWGANILLPAKAPLPYIQLDFSFDRTQLDSPKDEYLLPGSISLATLTSHANKYGLKGWEVFTGIPASLGGALFMNAGTNLGEIGSVVKSFKVVTRDGKEKEIIVDKNTFSYRKNNALNDGDIIVEARLVHFGIDEKISIKIKEYLEMRTKTQPLKEWTCGCVFKNHHNDVSNVTCRAGQFIDIMGLKGLTYKNLQISPKHANFMENKGDATYEDVITMIGVLQKELKLQFGIDFETEVEH